MNTLTFGNFNRARGWFAGFRASVVLAAVVLFAGLAPTTAHAQAHGFGGRGVGIGFGRGLVGGLGFGIGLGLTRELFSPYSFYDRAPGYVVYSTPVYYAPQPYPPVVVYAPAPAAPAPAIVYNPPAQPAPTSAPAAPVSIATGKTGRIVYDSNGKPVGIILLNPDGKQEFVPVVQ